MAEVTSFNADDRIIAAAHTVVQSPNQPATLCVFLRSAQAANGRRIGTARSGGGGQRRDSIREAGDPAQALQAAIQSGQWNWLDGLSGSQGRQFGVVETDSGLR
jgi:hypothetical protein